MGEMCFEAWGQFKRGFLMVAPGEISFAGQLKRGFDMVVMGEMCFEGMVAVENGV